VVSLVTDCPDLGRRPFVALENVESATGRLANGEIPEREAPNAGAAAVEPGFVLFGKLRPYLAKTWLADRPAYASTELLALRPGEGIEGRWLAYVCSSRPLIDWAVATSDGTKMPRTSWEKLGAFRLQVPTPTAQREIADFLDAETARIDALVEKKRRMIALVGERARNITDEVLWANVEGEIPLMHVVQPQRPVMYGIVLPGPDVGEDGIPVVKGGDVGAGLTLGRLARTTPEIERPYARARLRPRDLLFAIRGGVGDAAIAPPELEGANITQDVARIAPGAEVSSEWLIEVLRSRTFQHRARELVRGATITGLNIRDLERIRIPWADRTRQEGDLGALRPLLAVSAGLSNRLERQIELLREHRQALITAALTGQLAVAAAA
jgi:type I restriction enzyme S subunit